MGYGYWNSTLYCVVDRMELEIDSKILLKALNTVEMKGKYLGDNGLTNSSLGEFVKVFAVADGWRTGYYFCNGNNHGNNKKKECTRCNKTGKSENFNKHYPFDVDNVKEFAHFCLESGGFSIN